MGIKPDIIVLRTDEPITDESIFQKIALFCNVRPDCVHRKPDHPRAVRGPAHAGKAPLFRHRLPGAPPGGPCPGPLGVDGPGKTDPLPKETVRVALVGKYVQAPRRLPLGDGGFAPRGLRPVREGGHRLGGL